MSSNNDDVYDPTDEATDEDIKAAGRLLKGNRSIGPDEYYAENTDSLDDETNFSREEAMARVVDAASEGDTITFTQRQGSYTVADTNGSFHGDTLDLENGGEIAPYEGGYVYNTEAEANDPTNANYKDGIVITGLEVNGNGPTDLENTESTSRSGEAYDPTEEFSDDRHKNTLESWGVTPDHSDTDTEHEEEQASEFGVDDREDASRGAQNDADEGEQETLFTGREENQQSLSGESGGTLESNYDDSEGTSRENEWIHEFDGVESAPDWMNTIDGWTLTEYDTPLHAIWEDGNKNSAIAFKTDVRAPYRYNPPMGMKSSHGSKEQLKETVIEDLENRTRGESTVSSVEMNSGSDESTDTGGNVDVSDDVARGADEVQTLFDTLNVGDRVKLGSFSDEDFDGIRAKTVTGHQKGSALEMDDKHFLGPAKHHQDRYLDSDDIYYGTASDSKFWTVLCMKVVERDDTTEESTSRSSGPVTMEDMFPGLEETKYREDPSQTYDPTKEYDPSIQRENYGTYGDRMGTHAMRPKYVDRNEEEAEIAAETLASENTSEPASTTDETQEETDKDEEEPMTEDTFEVEFGNRELANEYREKYSEHTTGKYDARYKSIEFVESLDEASKEDVTAAAAGSRADKESVKSQSDLTDHEMNRIEDKSGFTGDWVTPRWVKGTAGYFGINDWVTYYDPELSVDEHVSKFEDDRKDEVGKNMDAEADEEDNIDEEFAVGHQKAQRANCDSAEEMCVEEYDDGACSHLVNNCGWSDEDIEEARNATELYGEEMDSLSTDDGGDVEPEEIEVDNFPTIPEDEELPGFAQGTLARAWNGYRQSVSDAEYSLKIAKAYEQQRADAERYAAIINDVREQFGQEPMSFNEMDETTHLDELPPLDEAVSEGTEDKPTPENTNNPDASVEWGQSTMASFTNDGGVYDPSNEF